MKFYQLDWTVEGTAVVEAEDAIEAQEILADGLSKLDSSMFEMIDVHRVSAVQVEDG